MQRNHEEDFPPAEVSVLSLVDWPRRVRWRQVAPWAAAPASPLALAPAPEAHVVVPEPRGGHTATLIMAVPPAAGGSLVSQTTSAGAAAGAAARAAAPFPATAPALLVHGGLHWIPKVTHINPNLVVEHGTHHGRDDAWLLHLLAAPSTGEGKSSGCDEGADEEGQARAAGGEKPEELATVSGSTTPQSSCESSVK